MSDDSPVVRKIARRIIEGMHYRATRRRTAARRSPPAQFGMPDAIFVDAQMPVLDGFEFLKEVRHMPGGERPKIVYCVAEHDVAQIARAMHAGADDYIDEAVRSRGHEVEIRRARYTLGGGDSQGHPSTSSG